jgi:hypothetical protein
MVRFVGGAAQPSDQGERFEPFEHRRQRGRIHLQQCRYPLHRQGIRAGSRMPPQRQHHQVLRMGQTERLEQRPVHGQHRTVGDRQRETHLAFQRQRIDVRSD